MSSFNGIKQIMEEHAKQQEERAKRLREEDMLHQVSDIVKHLCSVIDGLERRVASLEHTIKGE